MTPLSFIIIEPVGVHVLTPLNELALKDLLRKHAVPERYWKVGYFYDPSASYHFTPVPTERPTT